ncbi:MAG: Mut7-C RNAse domain-containing protein [Desulfobacterales bacterium]
MVLNPCFAADKTLGRLAKWLRLLGFDTLLESERADEKFIDSLEKDRILLTRTHRIRKQSADRKLIFVESDHLRQQLNQVVRELGLKAEQTRPFSRCLQCNVPIVAVDKNILRGRVPDYIFETHDHFDQCPQCDRIFWPGSHTQRSLEKIRHLFDIE